MGYEVAVATHAVLVAVEDGRVDEVRVLGPVPVGLVAFVVTFGTEGCLVGPDVVAVPVLEDISLIGSTYRTNYHEVRSCMYCGGVVHVDDDEVIISTFSSWVLARRELRGLLEYAFDGSSVLFSFILGQVTTAFISRRI